MKVWRVHGASLNSGCLAVAGLSKQLLSQKDMELYVKVFKKYFLKCDLVVFDPVLISEKEIKHLKEII